MIAILTENFGEIHLDFYFLGILGTLTSPKIAN
jgi:hypothetical protein